VQVGASLEQVRGEAMAEHVGIDTFFNPGTAGRLDTGVIGRLVIHGVISAVPGIAGKQPDRLFAQTSPVSPQFLEQDRAEHDVAVLVTLAVLNVHDHASAIDVADLQARELGAAHAGAVKGHQNGAIERSRRSIDELCDFFLTENGGQAIALLGIRSVGNAPGPLERLDVEEAQGAEMVGHRTGSQFVHPEELGLVLADVLRSQAIGRAVEVLGEALNEANVTLCGSLRVMTTLSF
jgi:hypothetical protein